MTNQIEFSAKPRTITGKKVYTLRQVGQVPAHIYGGEKGSVNIAVDAVAFSKLYEEAGETGLINLTVEGEKKGHPVLIDEVQTAPVRDQILSVSFKEVNLNVKIEADIPVEIVGEVDIPNSVVNTVIDVIPVEALPANLPDKFELDVSSLTEIGQALTVKDLSYDSSKVTLLLDEDQLEEPLVTISEVAEEKEPEVIETEVIGSEEETENEASEAGEEKSEPTE